MSISLRRLTGLIACAVVVTALPLSATARTEDHRTTAHPSGSRAAPLHARLGTPRAYSQAFGDTWYNTVAANGNILSTANDTRGYARSCNRNGHAGSNIAINRITGPPGRLRIRTTNCMRSYGPLGGGGNHTDGCTWKTGGITRVRRVVYLVVARQLRNCDANQKNGLQPSFDASIVRSPDGGKTWINPWGARSTAGAAPRWIGRTHHYRAMFDGRQFSAPFFIQYGPGNTHTVDNANKFLYAVSTDGFAYDGNYLTLGRVPINKVQRRGAWRFYHVRTTKSGQRERFWGKSLHGAVRMLRVKHGISQPAIQYVPSLKRYLLLTFHFRYSPRFPNDGTPAYSTFTFYQAPHPWGPWTRFFGGPTQRSLWCGSHCSGSRTDHFGFFDPALVQKFVFTQSLRQQTILTSGNWKNPRPPWTTVPLNRLRAVPFSLTR